MVFERAACAAAKCFTRQRRLRRVVMLISVAIVLVVGAAPQADATTVWAVGDGANSGSHDDAVAAMIAADRPAGLFYLGDVYESGTAAEYAKYYEPGFGRLKGVTFPVAGNHEWPNRSVGFFPYWRARFGGRDVPDVYSFDIGGWHVVALNTEADFGAGSVGLNTVKADLARRSGNCTIALTHKPRWSALIRPKHGDQPSLDPLWKAMKGKVAFVLSGHDHLYQRLHRDGGIQFVVGTGGKMPDPFVWPFYAGLQEWEASWRGGALRFDLQPGRAGFMYREPGGDVPDRGVIGCARQIRPASARR